ncbi:hypothetical protein [Clostridium sp. Marseille-Q2269]|uniref:tetratricopeptide repeat protein n=1 Tax=Clostridium sp. Marseille-Q2269 TaxID=2942205 RepID=UPI0020744735|nr:hypothetical protein [Clostridium sp. Marseille-Q2269]
MNFDKKKLGIVFWISIIVFTVATFISYSYGKKVIIQNLIKSGHVYINKKEYDKAIAIYEEVVKYDKDSNDKNMLNLAIAKDNSWKFYHDGMVCYKKGEYLKALKLFEGVMESDNETFNKAQEKIEQCKEKYIKSNLNNAEQCMHNSNYNEANKYLDKVFSLDKNNKDAKRLEKILNKKYF